MSTYRAKNIKSPIFRERFSSLRGDMTQDAFAKFLDISRPTVGFYENGERVPDIINLEKIARKCNVSSDWLIGISNIKSTCQNIQCHANYVGVSEEALANIKDLQYYRTEDDKLVRSKIDVQNRNHIFSKVAEDDRFSSIFTRMRAAVSDFADIMEAHEKGISTSLDYNPAKDGLLVTVKKKDYRSDDRQIAKRVLKSHGFGSLPLDDLLDHQIEIISRTFRDIVAEAIKVCGQELNSTREIVRKSKEKLNTGSEEK